MKKLLIFDLDGTLVDTLLDLSNSVNFALKKFHFPIKEVEEVRKAIGNGTIKLIERCAPIGTEDNILKKLHSEFKKHYQNNIANNTIPYKNVSSVLFYLKSKGYKLAVVSNKDHDLTIKIINDLFPKLFDVVQGSYHDHPKKPDPFLIEKVIKEMGVNKNALTYIGDTNVDEESALNASLDYIIVSYGYRTKEELLHQVKTRNIIDEIKNLEKIF